VAEHIQVEVAYASETKQLLLAVEVAEGCTAYEVVTSSGLLAHFPTLDLEQVGWGVWNERVKDPKGFVLKAGDRVELYRGLKVDPKEARRGRASQKKKI
jgi:putative ubiquitin-RnfH superfamily antitoxin RatB of RatAB toxin-antitoxin module